MADLEVVPLTMIQEKLLSLSKRFNISLPDFATGTILNVRQLADSWNEESFNHLFVSLQDLIPPFDIPSFQQYLYVAGNDNFGKVEAKYYDDFDYKVSAKYNQEGLFVDVQRNELDINALRSEYRGLFELDDMKRFPYRLEDFEQESYQLRIKLNELSGIRDSKLLEEYASKLGAFRFDFYFVKIQSRISAVRNSMQNIRIVSSRQHIVDNG